jgi:RHS repeat-associated protein
MPRGIADANGDVQERQAYSAYGKPSFLTPVYGNRTESAFDWETLFSGYRLDKEVDLYHVRYRTLDVVIGAWLTRDPITQSAVDWNPFHSQEELNVYRYANNRPPSLLDYLGLCEEEPISISAKEEKESGDFDKKRDETPCTPISIEMTKGGLKPFIKRTRFKPDQPVYAPNKEGDPNDNPWLGRGGPGMKVGDRFPTDPARTPIRISLEWVLTFNGNPRNCTWGRNVVRPMDAFVTKAGGLRIPNSAVRHDPSLNTDYIVGNKVYMYDQPGRKLPVQPIQRYVFEVWAKSSDGKTRISKWYYVAPNGAPDERFYEVNTPTLYDPPPIKDFWEYGGQKPKPGTRF